MNTQELILAISIWFTGVFFVYTGGPLLIFGGVVLMFLALVFVHNVKAQS